MIKIYKNRTSEPKLQLLKTPEPDSWTQLESPSNAELVEFASAHNLDLDMLKDGIDQNESPRIDHWQGTTYIYVRYCLPENQKLTTAPLLIVINDTFFATLCSKPFTGMQAFVGGTRDFSTAKRGRLVFQILEEISLGYKSRINTVSKRIWDIRQRLDKQHIDNKSFVEMIDIEEDLGDFLSALEPMSTVLHSLMMQKYFKLYDDDADLAEDIKLGTQELITLTQSRLRIITNIREAYSTIMANNLNKVFKLMTSITILMSIFTIITGVYSMNISLPLAHEGYVFWVILGFSFSLIAILATVFRKKKWL